MKIFVTGGSGFIGQHLIRRLASSAHEVRCLVRKTSNLSGLQGPNIQLVTGDVLDPAALRNGMQDCDWVFHLANLYSMWEQDRQNFYNVNVLGTKNVMETALAAGICKVVHVSTVAVYGKPLELPFDEECDPGPEQFSEYGRTKAIGDQIAWELYREKGLPLVVLYPGIVLGDGDHKASGQYIQDIIHRAVPSTIFHRSIETYVYVGDVVEAILKAAELPNTIGQRYLLGRTALNGRDYARLIGEIAHVPLPWFHLPDWFVKVAAGYLTLLSRFTNKAPKWGFSADAARTLQNGFYYDGSRAERELGIHYTPVRQALTEAIESYHRESSR